MADTIEASNPGVGMRARSTLSVSSLWVWLALTSVASASPASAQVNAEMLSVRPLRAGWALGADTSLALARGNVELLDVGGVGRIQHQTLFALRPPRDGQPAQEIPFVSQRLFVTGSGRFAERADVPFINQAFAHARWTRMWHERVGSDVFAQYQFNEFLRLTARAVTGVGLRLEAVHTLPLMLWGGSGYMFEYDRIEVVPGTYDPRETFEHRWTNYLTVRLAQFDSRLLVQNTVYYQPRFDAFRDYRILEELEVLSKVSEVFALGTTLTVLHDSTPPSRVRNTDLRLANTIRLSF